MIDRVGEQADNYDAGRVQQSTSDSEHCPSCSDGDERSTPVCLTDGGHPTAQEVIERRTDIDMTDAVEVDHYPKESVLAAYRVGDEHIVVTNEDKTEQAQIKRVQATRAAVLQGERLWTIPSDWTVDAKIRVDGTQSLLCRLPKKGNVIVECPSTKSSTLSRYEVVKVGNLRNNLVDKPDIKQMARIHRKLEEQDETDSELLDALDEFGIRWGDFEYDYRAYFDKWGNRAVNSVLHTGDVTILDSRVLNPWDEEQSFLHLLPNVPKISDHAEEISEILVDAGVVSLYPRFEIDVYNWHDVPIGYHIEALIELGCTPTEAVDYLLIEERRRSRAWAKSPISPWADSRGVTEATVRENIAAAKEQIPR